jgi:hypothetical protein
MPQVARAMPAVTAAACCALAALAVVAAGAAKGAHPGAPKPQRVLGAAAQPAQSAVPGSEASEQPSPGPTESGAPQSPLPQQSGVPEPQESVEPAAPAPVVISPAGAEVILGHTVSVHVVSPPSGLLTLSGFDANIVRAVFNPIERSIDLFGLKAGSTTVTATGESGLSATLSVTVLTYAGKASNSASAVITGNPASADFVAQTAAQAAKLVAYPESGARVLVDPTQVKQAHQLPANNASTVLVPLSITGPGYAPYNQTVSVRLTNVAQPALPPKNLLVSDFPETIVENGTLFYADVNFDDPARLLYYHYAAARSITRRVLVKAQNSGVESSLVMLISGIAGPDPNILSIGHESTKRFLIHEAAGEGQIFEVPPGATINVVDQLLPAGNLVSGLMQMRVVAGDGVRVAVVVQNADETAVEPISDTLLSSAVKHARGIYQVPDFFYDVSYAVGEDPATLTIGKLPLPNLVQGEVLGGDYGVKQSAAITLLNSTPRDARVGMWFEPRGGRATGTFLIDGRLVQLHPVDVGRPALMRTFIVPARGYRKINIVTMPEGGSSYPVRVTFASDPPPNGGWNMSPAVY